MRLIGVVVAVMVVSDAGAIAARQPPPTEPGSTADGYEEFMKLAPGARRERFSAMTAEQKVIVKRTHAERWLAENRSRLSTEQIAVATEAIAFVRPQIYLRAHDPEILQQEEAVKRKLACVLGHANARDAFVLDTPPSGSEARTWRSTVDAWLSWFSECVFR